MNTPPITSLVVAPTPLDPRPSRSWEPPFMEFLGFLELINPLAPFPQVLSQRFCFQPSQDLSEISKIFISGSTSSMGEFDIDLNSFLFLDSDAVPPAATKLHEYANHVLKRIQVFRDCLLEYNVIKDVSSFLKVDLFTCPLCYGDLLSCVKCDSIVACGVMECPASLSIPCEFCPWHRRMACHPCTMASDKDSPIVRCPICDGWCCREDVAWCSGLVTHPARGSEELNKLSREHEWDHESIVRSHSPKPGPCLACATPGEGPGWASCVMDTSEHCPSKTRKLGLRPALCPECLEARPGCGCACGVSWFCDHCLPIALKYGIYPLLITCPRCGANYCTHPNYPCKDSIGMCMGCWGAIACNNCQEEETLPGEVQFAHDRPKEVVFTDRCTFCEAWSCPDCVESERTETCDECDAWYCYDCVTDKEYVALERCRLCDTLVCRLCPADHNEVCPGSFPDGKLITDPYD